MAYPSRPPSNPGHTDRRGFLKKTSLLGAASLLAGVNVPTVYAAGSDTLRIALVGCGGRGGGAAVNALSTPHGPVKLVALADVFEDRVKSTLTNLSQRHADQMDVTPERMFVGFDAYKHAIDCLRPGDVVILATPPAFRWPQFKYAIDKGVNCFMEKPLTVDGPTTLRMLELAELSEKKNLKVGVGLMCRHCNARQELFDRIQSGQLGDLILLRATRAHGPIAECFVPANPGNLPETMYQIQKFHGFLWASGGLYSDFYIHNIDECCWMKNAWPVRAEALGGRHYRGEMVDQNFDTYDVEYTFDDGAKLFAQGRCMDGCANKFGSYAHGSTGSAVISAGGHTSPRCRIWRGQDMSAKPAWAFSERAVNPYQAEWDHLLDAIRKDQPFNEVRRGAEASLVASMGRMAAHTGQIITYEEMLKCDHEFAPEVDKLTPDGPAPVLAGADGTYPLPQPGIKGHREY